MWGQRIKGQVRTQVRWLRLRQAKRKARAEGGWETGEQGGKGLLKAKARCSGTGKMEPREVIVERGKRIPGLE